MKIKLILPLSLLLFMGTQLFAQTIELDPAKGWQGKLMDVGISGTNTTFASASSTCGELDIDKIMFHQGMTTFSPISLDIESDFQLYTQVAVEANAPLGFYDVILWPGQGACEISCQDCYEIFPPSSIISVTPDEENINTTNLDVTISTDYSCFTQGSSTCQVNPGNVRFIQTPPGNFDFQPNTVTIVDDKTLVANIDIPSFTIVGDYNVVVAEGFPCEASCISCFDVLADPFLELITGNQARRGEDTTIVLQVYFADLASCFYDGTTVFLQQGNYIIYPNDVTINGQIINIDVTIPPDAPVGDYDIVVGDQLGGDCEYLCSGCFTVDAGVGTFTPVYEEEIIVFPNPNKGSFVISSEITLKDAVLQIFDSAGRLVVDKRMGLFKDMEINLDAQGIYYLKLSTREATQIQRIVVD